MKLKGELERIFSETVTEMKDQIRDEILSSVYGQHDAYWLGFYEYFHDVCNLIEETKPLDGLWKIAKNAGWLIPYDKICLISERHNVCNLKDGKLHCDGGPAIQYLDGFSVWALNGVVVSQEIAETPAEQLDPHLILTEKNAEVRKEVVRKIGLDRMALKLNPEVIDKDDRLKGGPYELLKFKIPGMQTPVVALKMINPSIGCFHVEYVPGSLKTCKEANEWRIGNIHPWEPEIIT